ncbi:hypothetical protein EV426DRAFT_576845 [Tirmania nivea]|nr:hypothetical protein EV426DRAFT_576845 [Tirmania nivea]
MPANGKGKGKGKGNGSWKGPAVNPLGECSKGCGPSCPPGPETTTLDLIRHFDGPTKYKPAWLRAWDEIEDCMERLDTRIHDWIDGGGDKNFVGILATARCAKVFHGAMMEIQRKEGHPGARARAEKIKRLEMIFGALNAVGSSPLIKDAATELSTPPSGRVCGDGDNFTTIEKRGGSASYTSYLCGSSSWNAVIQLIMLVGRAIWPTDMEDSLNRDAPKPSENVQMKKIANLTFYCCVAYFGPFCSYAPHAYDLLGLLPLLPPQAVRSTLNKAQPLIHGVLTPSSAEHELSSILSLPQPAALRGVQGSTVMPSDSKMNNRKRSPSTLAIRH